MFWQVPVAVGPWEASGGGLHRGSHSPTLLGRGQTLAPRPPREGRRPSTSTPEDAAPRGHCCVSAGRGKRRDHGSLEGNPWAGPCRCVVDFFFPSDPKYLTTRVECLVGRGGEASPLLPARRLHAVRLQLAPLPVGRGPETRFDPCWALGPGRGPWPPLQMWGGRVRTRPGVVQGGPSPGGGPATAGPCSLRLPGSG